VALALLAAGGVALVVKGDGAGKSTSNDGQVTSSQGGSSWVAPAWATKADDIGPADPATVVTGTVYFAKADQQTLDQFAGSVGAPGSAEYHHYLTVDEFHSRFVNHVDASQAVTQWVRQAGMTVVSQDAESIVVSTTIAEVERTLKIKIDRFRHQGRVDISPTSQPQYPANVGDYVASVTGLTTSSPVNQPPAPKAGQNSRAGGAAAAVPLLRPRATAADAPPAAARPATARPAVTGALKCSDYYGQNPALGYPPAPGGSGTPPMEVCGYSPSQIRSAYGVQDSGLTGKGVTIAIVDAFASPTIDQDLAEYDRQAGLPAIQLQQVLPSSFDSRATPADAAGWYGEETLDIEAAHTIAPEAKIIYYAARSADESALDAPLHTIVEQRSADIVSGSWGIAETAGDQDNLAAETQIFEQGAAEGIGFDFSTGDAGDFTAGDDPSSTPTVNEPADNPWATAVGGTTLGIGAHGDYQWETGWGEKSLPFRNGGWDGTAATFAGAAGGGTSRVFPRPAYQQGVVADSLARAVNPAQPGRVLPDVAMLADSDTGFLVGMSSGTVRSRPSGDGSGVRFEVTGASFGVQSIGGTSLASPLFAGMEALAAQASGSPLGFADPVLYRLAGTPEFHDVTPSPAALGHEPYQVTGDRNGSPVLMTGDLDTSLRTTAGFDDVTGIGSPAPGFLTWFRSHPKGS
jgi:subtilase family serine protease